MNVKKPNSRQDVADGKIVVVVSHPTATMPVGTAFVVIRPGWLYVTASIDRVCNALSSNVRDSLEITTRRPFTSQARKWWPEVLIPREPLLRDHCRLLRLHPPRFFEGSTSAFTEFCEVAFRGGIDDQPTNFVVFAER